MSANNHDFEVQPDGIPIFTPDQAPKDVHISGRIITAMPVIPWAVYRKYEEPEHSERTEALGTIQGAVTSPEIDMREEFPEVRESSKVYRWALRRRRGRGAMFATQNILEQLGKWDTILVGWTGELELGPGASGGSIGNDPDAVYQADLSDREADDVENLIKSEAAKAKCNIEPLIFRNRPQREWLNYAEHLIWPLFHYIVSDPSDSYVHERKWWKSYVEYNQAYADRIVKLYKPGDIILVHDYSLLLLPRMLREKFPKIYVGFFLHTPFPSSEYIRCCAHRREIMDGMLGSSMVAFQTESYKNHFVSSCTRILGYESSGRNVIETASGKVAAVSFPIGINLASVTKGMQKDSVVAKMKALRELYKGKKIIVGRDRLDSIRGVAQKLRAYQAFLEAYPEWIENCVLIQVTTPAYTQDSREDKKVAELVAEINGKFGMIHYSPVQHYASQISQDEYYALLRVADLALITSVRDGMNLTSLDYVLCQSDTQNPLVISEFSGTAEALDCPIKVNPWDSAGVAEAIHVCLTMPDEEKSDRFSSLHSQIMAHPVEGWINSFLTQLLLNLHTFGSSHATPLLDRRLLLDHYRKSKQRLFMFDYDGTLTPIVREPSAAIPTDKVIRTLKLLASDHKNKVWIISGRDQTFLEKWLGNIENLGLSAEHGSFIKEAGTGKWINLAANFDMSWQKEVLDIFQYYTERTQGSSIERKRASLTWHYRRADPEFGAFQARECQNYLEHVLSDKYAVEVMAGKANLEVRPRFVNKGEIAKRLVTGYGDSPPDFVLCVGDDATDEFMFDEVRKLTDPLTGGTLKEEDAFCVTVGPASKKTLGKWHLPDPAAVIDIAGMLVGTVDVKSLSGNLKVRDKNREQMAKEAEKVNGDGDKDNDKK